MKINMKNILFLLEIRAPGLTKLLVKFRALFAFADRWTAARKIRELISKHNAELAGQIADLKTWEDSFHTYLMKNPRNLPIFDSFMHADIQPVVLREIKDDSQSPIALCVVKNDLRRMEMVVNHHRKIGIRHFAILDNGSDDGTLDWLVAQPDIDVFSVAQPFQSLRKYGWINRIIARYGYNRWYLYVDSDELFVYPGIESMGINELCQMTAKRGEDRIAAIMLDMYADRELYSPTLDDQPIEDQYCYFDSDSYTLTQSRRGPVIKGGPRKRLFSEKKRRQPAADQIPAVQFQARDDLRICSLLVSIYPWPAGLLGRPALQIPFIRPETP